MSESITAGCDGDNIADEGAQDVERIRQIQMITLDDAVIELLQTVREAVLMREKPLCRI